MEANAKKSDIARIVFISGLILAVLLFVGFMGYKALVLRSAIGPAIYPAKIVEKVNLERQKIGLSPLSENRTLAEAAQAKANDMAARGYFSHNTPDGRTPWQFMDEAGYYFSYAGENLAVDFFDTKEITGAWMESEGHRENILNIDFLETGIGVAAGNYEDREVLFYVQMFGRRGSESAVADGGPSDIGRVLGASTENNLANVVGVNPEKRTSLLLEFLTNPTVLLKYIYYILTAAILGAILGAVVISQRLRNSLHTATYGLSSTFIIWILFYIYNSITILL